MPKRARSTAGPQGWLAKTEPDAFGIDDLKREKTTSWSGVRNYQARNHLRSMQVGDQVLIYHSSCAVPAIVGLGRVVRAGYPDPLQFDPDSQYFDGGSKREDPRWTTVDIAFVSRFAKPLSRDDLRADPDWAAHILITGTRLSVMPVDAGLLMATIKRAQS